MNLALFSVGEIFGGVEQQVLDLCRFRLNKGRPAPLVILFHDRELASRLRDIGVEPAILGGRHRYDTRVVRELVELLRRDEIEIVHVHGYKATIVAALAKRRLTFVLVKTEHGIVEARLSRPLTYLKARVNAGLELFLTRRAVDAVCYVTDDIRQHFAQAHRGIVRQTVHNGIEPLSVGEFERPSDLPAGEFHLGIVGRVTAIKGIPVAIEALRLLASDRPVVLNIIGTGNLSESLQELAGQLGLTDVVRLLGFRRNINDYMAHLDVLLMPSYHEGLPYTLLEAMSLSRPVVVSDVGGLREVIRDGYNGLLCPPGQPAALAASLDRLIADDALCQTVGANARADQLRSLTLEAMGNSYEEVYDRAQSQQAKARTNG